MVGSLLGDGSLIYNKKDAKGNNKLTTNANYAITLKNKDYIDHMYSLLSSLCTKSGPIPWPNPNDPKNKNKNKPVYQYRFSTRSLPSLSNIYDQWYYWDSDHEKYIKKVPENIQDLLTDKSLAIWIMDDGFKVGNGVGLATESFGEKEIDRLKSVLENKFGLLVYKRPLITSGGRRSPKP